MKHLIGALMTMLTVAACGAGVDSDPQQIGDDDSEDPRHDSSKPCPELDGPRHDYTTKDEVQALLTGRWIQCSGPTPWLLDGGVGVELAADGNYYTLVKDSHGEVVRDTGFSSQGTWRPWQVDGSPDIWLQLWATPSTLFDSPPLFEDGPRRFAVKVGYDDRPFAVYQSIP